MLEAERRFPKHSRIFKGNGPHRQPPASSSTAFRGYPATPATTTTTTSTTATTTATTTTAAASKPPLVLVPTYSSPSATNIHGGS